MHTEADYRRVLKTVTQWPTDQRLALVQDVLATVKNEAGSPGARRDTLSRAVGLLRGPQPPPDDETVRRWIDEHRMQKYGG